MDKKTRKHSICEKMPYIAIILSVLFPSLLAGIGGSIGNAISENAGNIGVCFFAYRFIFRNRQRDIPDIC